MRTRFGFLVVVALLLGGCAPAPEVDTRPDPLPLAEQYVAAFAAGDSDALAALDGDPRDQPRYSPEAIDLLDTDALDDAVDHIRRALVVSNSADTGNDYQLETVRVVFSVTLARFDLLELGVVLDWDAAADTWIVRPLLELVVLSFDGPVPADLTISGIPVTPTDDFEVAVMVYPGVYRVETGGEVHDVVVTPDLTENVIDLEL